MPIILKDIFSEEPPAALYHYTNQRGLLGIINDKSIWATHTQYLNDRREYTHALDLVVEETRKRLEKEESEERKMDLEDILSGLSGIERMNVCVCSFSELNDSLSQWRAYGAETSGFALGFTGRELRILAEKENFFLAKCIYDENDQRDLVRQIIDGVLVDSHDEREKEVEDVSAGQIIGARMNHYGPVFKHSSFKEEKEWRIISRPLSVRRDNFKYREGNSSLIPYYSVSLTAEEVPFPLSNVVVGPTPHQVNSKSVIGSLLVKHGLHKRVTLELSAVPYRNW